MIDSNKTAIKVCYVLLALVTTSALVLNVHRKYMETVGVFNYAMTRIAEDGDYRDGLEQRRELMEPIICSIKPGCQVYFKGSDTLTKDNIAEQCDAGFIAHYIYPGRLYTDGDKDILKCEYLISRPVNRNGIFLLLRTGQYSCFKTIWKSNRLVIRKRINTGHTPR